MKNYTLYLLCYFFALAKVYGQELELPEVVTPENTFYTYLDNEKISDPTKYNGKVRKVVRTFKQYERGDDAVTTQKNTAFLNTEGVLEKTMFQTYSYGIEDYKEVTDHLEKLVPIIKKEGNKTIKIFKNNVTDESSYNDELKGDDHYVYENDRLLTFYNQNDSISYVYNVDGNLVEVRGFESKVYESYEEETEEIAFYREEFLDRALEKVRYNKGLPVEKITYNKFGEVIDVYKKTYSYSSTNLLEKFQTEYKRYLFDYYVDSMSIDKQEYKNFPIVELSDSIQVGTFQYSKTNKITAYQRTKGAENEIYTVTYDENDRMSLVEGTLHFYRRGKIVPLNIEYEYKYDEKGNPKSIRSYYYVGSERMLDKETIFEIEYYTD